MGAAKRLIDERLQICHDIQPALEALRPALKRYQALGSLLSDFGAGSSNQLCSDWRIRGVLSEFMGDVVHPSHRIGNLAEAEQRILDQVRDLERQAAE